MAQLSLTLLGGFQARLASGPLALPTKKAQALLAYLALRPGQAHPRDKLAALLWGDTGEAQARDSLRHTLLALRKGLAAAKVRILLIEGQTVALNPAVVDADVAAFERRMAEGSPEALEQAAALYQGDLLEGLGVREAPFEEWLLAERERLRELALEALAKLLAHQSKAGATERAIQTALRLLALDPLQEAVHQTLMRLYARQGRQAMALKQYQVCVGVLQRELGVDPEAETKQLYQDILQRRSALAAPAAASPSRLAPRPRPGPVRFRSDVSPSEMPLIGRESELARLRQALGEAWRGRGLFVMILGEAGIGKSRLIEELTAEGLQRGGRVLLGRAYEMQQIFPFGPWVDALRPELGSPPGSGLEGLSGVWRAELARLFPELGKARLPLTTHAGDYLRLFEALAQLVGHLAVRQPLALILEDLHWADEMSLRLLFFLGRRVEAWPVLVVGTAREEELASVPLLHRLLEDLNREQRLVHLPLSPLSRPDTVSLVQALARAGSEAAWLTPLAEQVWAVSEGNPFIVVETIRALQEERTLQAPSRLSLPQRVREVIGGRLARLSDQSQQLVAVAAVIGREFEFPLLQRAAGLGEREAAEGVEELVRRRVLHGVGERFDFTHDRIREVAYDQLLLPRRKLLHGLVAKALEEPYADDLEPHYVPLGMHYREGGVWSKALDYLLKAAQSAAKAFANRDAVALYGQALEAAGHLGEAVEPKTLMAIHQAKFNLYFILSDFERSRAEAEQLLGLARRAGDRVSEGTALGGMAWATMWARDLDRAVAYARQAIEVAEQTDAKPVLARGHFSIGWVRAVTGGLDQARQEFDKALTISRSASDVFHQSLSLSSAGLIKNWEGEYATAARLQSEGLLIAREHNLLVPLLYSFFLYGMTLTGKGDYDTALATFEEGLALSEKVGDEVIHHRLLNCLGWLHLELGNLDQAIELNRRGAEVGRRWGDPGTIPNAELNLGEIFMAKGDLALAQEFFEGVYRFARDPATSDWMRWRYSIRLFANLGNLWLARGELVKAREFANQCLELATRSHSRKNLVKGWRLKGEIALARRQWDEAETALRQARTIAQAIGNPTQLWKSHLAFGRLHGELKKSDAAQQAYRKARAVIDGIRASLQNQALRASFETSPLIRQVYEVSVPS